MQVPSDCDSACCSWTVGRTAWCLFGRSTYPPVPSFVVRPLEFVPSVARLASTCFFGPLRHSIRPCAPTYPSFVFGPSGDGVYTDLLGPPDFSKVSFRKRPTPTTIFQPIDFSSGHVDTQRKLGISDCLAFRKQKTPTCCYLHRWTTREQASS
jgi:hypothetical protein